MKSKKIKIEYFLLLLIAFVFQISVKDEARELDKKYNGFSYEKNNEKELYAFIKAFQQKAESLNIKKSKELFRGKNEFLTLDNNVNSLKKFDYNFINYKQNFIQVSYSNLGFGFVGALDEKRHKSSYLV